MQKNIVLIVVRLQKMSYLYYTKEKLKRLQSTLLSLKSKYGSNILVKGTSLEEGATGMERNGQVGGHKA